MTLREGLGLLATLIGVVLVPLGWMVSAKIYLLSFLLLIIGVPCFIPNTDGRGRNESNANGPAAVPGPERRETCLTIPAGKPVDVTSHSIRSRNRAAATPTSPREIAAHGSSNHVTDAIDPATGRDPGVLRSDCERRTGSAG